FTVPAEGLPQWQNYMVDPGWTSDKWVQVTETRPGNRTVVHHIRVYVQPEKITGAYDRNGIGWYGPRFPPHVCPPRTAIHVPARSKLRFEMHYTPNGTAQDDRSMIGIRFADPKAVKKMVRAPFETNRVFKIPPGDPNYEVATSRTFTSDTLLLSVQPHMH